MRIRLVRTANAATLSSTGLVSCNLGWPTDIGYSALLTENSRHGFFQGDFKVSCAEH